MQPRFLRGLNNLDLEPHVRGDLGDVADDLSDHERERFKTHVP